MTHQEQIDAAVSAALKHYRRQATKGFIGLTIGLALALGLQQHDAANQRHEGEKSRQAIVRSGRFVSVDGCNRSFRFAKNIRGVLITAERESYRAFKAGQITPDRFQTAKAFYIASLAENPLPDCRRAARILTDDPTKVPDAAPTALFPSRDAADEPQLLP
jgi:hypothetical protein